MQQPDTAQGKMRSAVSLSAVSPPLGLVALSLVALLLSLVIPLRSAEVAHANPAAPTMPLSICIGHCHAYANWPGGVTHGEISQFQTVGLYSLNDGTDHISDEMWYIDTSHSCVNYSDSWIEAGEATRPGFTGNWYFWADCRPGFDFAPHFLYQPPGGDVGNFFEYIITYAGNKTFSVAMSNLSGNQQWFGQSTANTFQPNDIWVGLETTYTYYNNNHANRDYFQGTEWESLSGVWSYVATGGTPPQGNNAGSATWTWVTTPAPGNNGGLGYTQCCGFS